MQYVATKYRKHPLSFISGGCIILVTHNNGETKIYDKIKYPKKYIEAVLEESIASVAAIYLNNELIWTVKDQQPKLRRLVPLSKMAA